jgi:processive 1,2-diacylglycerol beta-glucosyltransferase
MDIIFFTTFVGAGHKRVAQAIQEGIKTYNPYIKTEIINIFKLLTPKLDNLLKKLYLLTLYYFPQFWKDYYLKEKDKDLFYFSLKYLAHKLYKFFNRIELPKLVICTQSIPARIISILKRIYKVNIPIIAVITDFGVHTYWVNKEIDYYIVASPKVKKILLQRGIEEEKILVFGIPTSLRFFKSKSTKSDFGFDVTKPLVILTGGGEGIGLNAEDIYKFCNDFLDLQIGILCGNNQRLKKELLSFSDDRKNIKVFDYIEHPEGLLTCADLIITKPGGVTIAEAINIGLPIILLKPTCVIEKINIDYLLKEDIAFYADDTKTLKKYVTQVLSSKNIIKEKLKRLAQPQATIKTASFIINSFFKFNIII